MGPVATTFTWGAGYERPVGSARQWWRRDAGIATCARAPADGDRRAQAVRPPSGLLEADAGVVGRPAKEPDGKIEGMQANLASEGLLA